MSAVTIPITIPIGPATLLSDAPKVVPSAPAAAIDALAFPMIADKLDKPPLIELIAVNSFPTPVNTGPIAAAANAILIIMSLVPWSKPLNFSTSSLILSRIFSTVGSKLSVRDPTNCEALSLRVDILPFKVWL